MMVISIAMNHEAWEELIPFLIMARATLKEQQIDSELIFSYAKCGDKYLGEIENFIQEPNQADHTRTAERCMENKLYNAAKILWSKVGNN